MTPDKQELIERMTQIFMEHGIMVTNRPSDLVRGSLVAIADAWLEDRELHGVKQRLVELDLLEQALNQGRDLNRYKILRCDDLCLQHDTLTNKDKENK